MTFISQRSKTRQYGVIYGPFGMMTAIHPYNPLTLIRNVYNHLLNETYHVFQPENNYNGQIIGTYNYIRYF
jgi:hypothetical protein